MEIFPLYARPVFDKIWQLMWSRSGGIKFSPQPCFTYLHDYSLYIVCNSRF